MRQSVRKPGFNLAQLIIAVILSLYMLTAGKVSAQYQVVFPFADYGIQYTISPGMDSLKVLLWGAGAQGGFVWNYNTTFGDSAGGGGACTISKGIRVSSGQTYALYSGTGAGLQGKDPQYYNTFYPPAPTTFGLYGATVPLVTANSGNVSSGGVVSAGQYVDVSHAGGKGGKNSPGAGYYASYSLGGGGAAGNPYTNGANGTDYNGSAGKPGIGQYGAGSGAVGAGYTTDYQFVGSGTQAASPGGGGGTYGGSGGGLLAAHFDTSHSIVYNTPGQYQWVVPAGVIGIYIQMHGAGGAGGPNGAGGGGSIVQSNFHFVHQGDVFNIIVGKGGTQGNSNGGNTVVYGNSPFGVYANGIYYDTAFGGHSGTGGQLNYTDGGYDQLFCYPGGNGGGQNGGGGAAANIFAAGLPGTANSGGAGYWGGGSGQNPGDVSAGFPGGGGTTIGGDGQVLISWTCSNNTYTGSIGNAHTVAYPPELIPDSIISISAPGVGKISYAWQSSTDGVHFGASFDSGHISHRFDKDSLQTTTWFRRGTNSCGVSSSAFGNWSDTVQVRVFSAANGKKNGQISGQVVTRNGDKIYNRKVYARCLTPLKGRAANYIDSATTDAQGQFSTNAIFYGDNTNGDSAVVRFKVYADTTGGHLYSPDTIALALGANSIYVISQAIKDTTVFAITGKVYQVCTGCLDSVNNITTITGGEDSVVITGLGNGNTPLKREFDSTFSGYQNPPGDYGRYSLNFQYADVYSVQPKYKNHAFAPGALNNINLNTNLANIDFKDTSTHIISGYFTAGCRDLIGTATLEFTDSVGQPGFDGKPKRPAFRKQVTTAADGYYSIRLPARKYAVHVVAGSGVINDPVNAGLQLANVQTFFDNLPKDSITRDITSADAVLNLVYKRYPTLQVTGLRIGCSNFAVWPQNEMRAIIFNAFQGPVSKGCPLDSSIVILSTSVTQQDNNLETDTLKVLNGSATINLKAGAPLTLAPYIKIFNAYLQDQYGRLPVLNDTTVHVVVTGVSVDSTAQTFVTVTPQVPMLVLHDPPGNQSFSAWSSTTSSQVSYSIQAQQSQGASAWAQVKVGDDQYVGIGVTQELKAWIDINGSLGVTSTNTSTNQFTLTTTNTNTLQTSSASNAIGPDADVFYGAAMNVKYTVGSQVDWDSAHCTFAKKPVMVFAPTGINTSFIYTQAQIRDVQIPKLQLAAQVTPDSAEYFNNQVKVWQQLLANNAANLQRAGIDSNLSFSSGASLSRSATLQSDTTNTYEFSMVIDAKVALEAGFQYGGVGLKGGVNVNTQWTSGHTAADTKSVQTTTSYTLADGGTNNLFSVNIKKDPVYGTPMFETVAGESNCPHEANTIALDSVALSSNVVTQTGLTAKTAVYTFNAGNLSIDPGTRTYKLYYNAASNPGGAIITIAGQAGTASSPVLLPISGGTQIPVAVRITRDTSAGVYNYDNIEFVMSDNCDGDISKSIFISTDFAAPVSGVSFVTPVDQWVVNKSSNNVMPVQFNGYDVTKLDAIALQYTPVGSYNWKTAFSYTKNSLGSGATGTTKTWNVDTLPDGAYNLRLVVNRLVGTVNSFVYSSTLTGVVDRKPPALFGTPQPANRIYVTGTQISYSYTENINNSNLTPGMVTMQNVTKNIAIPVQLSAYANTLIIVSTLNLTQQYPGDSFRVIVSGVSDLQGNVKTVPDTSYFGVIASAAGALPGNVNVTVGNNSLFENSKDSIAVLFSRGSAATSPTVIYYNIAGNAVVKKDFTLSYSTGQTPASGINGAQGSVLMPKGSSAVTVYLHPLTDSASSLNKTLTISLSPGGGYNLGANYSITATIVNQAVAVPTITSFAPASAAAGTTVTITGTGFTGATAVSFGGTAATSFTVVSATSVTAIVGAGTSGSVKVTTPGGAATKTGFTFVAAATPAITSFTPTTAPAGATVTITGTGFTGATAVSFGGTAATSFTVVSATSVTAIVGAGASGNVTVTTPGGTATKAGFTYVAAATPAITSFSPASAGANTTVTITGTGFTGATAVSFGGTAAKSFTVVSATSITAVLGTGASGSVSITTPAGTATKAGFVFIPAASGPAITSFSPTSASKGKTVTIAGTGLTGATAVSFGGTAAASFTVLGDTAIAAVVGAGATGVVSITTAKGTATKTGFTFTTCNPVTPVVSITDNTALAVCGGTSVTCTAKGGNGGSAPVYQWYKNNVAVGTNNVKYAVKPEGTDSVWCTMTSTAGCLTINPAKSNVLVFNVTPRLTPTVTIAVSPGKTVCSGTPITFTATIANTGDNPVYHWKKKGVAVGTNSATYAPASFKTGDSVTCTVTASTACVLPNSVTSLPIGITVNPTVTPTVTNTPSITGPVCAGTKMTFAATATDAGKPTYRWYKNNIAAGGSSSAAYADNRLVDKDSVWCVITSTGTCLASPTTRSNVYVYNVISKLPPNLTVANNVTGPLCPGTPVMFTAMADAALTNPIFVWKRNNIVVGANIATYTDSTPVNGDSIRCTMTETLPCTTGTVGISTTAVMLSFVTTPVPLQPSAINGAGSVTAGQAGLIYGVTKVTGLTYNWAVPAGVTIVSGQGTYRVTVNWGSISGNVSVTAGNNCGPSPATIKKVTVAAGLQAENLDPSASAVRGSTGALRAYPNPVTSTATVEFTAETVNKYEAQVMNSLGQLVTSKAGMTVKGVNTVKFEMGNLASAMYYVRLTDAEHGTRIIKLVKAK